MFPLNARFLFWLLGLLAFYTTIRSTYGKPAPATFKNHDKTSSDLFQRSLKELVGAGATKIFAAESHDLKNHHMYGNTLAGVSSSGLPVKLFLEMHFPTDGLLPPFPEADGARAVMEAFNLGGGRVDPAEYVEFVKTLTLNTLKKKEAPFISYFPSFEKRLLNRSIAMHLMHFDNVKAEDMTRFIQGKGVAVAQLGAAHALWTIPKLHHFSLPWRPGVERPLPREFKVSRPTLELQREMMDGLRRAQQRGPAILVTTAQLLKAEDPLVGKKDAVINYFLSEGYSALEVNFPAVNDALYIFSPCALLPVLTRVTAGVDDQHLFRVMQQCPQNEPKGEL